MDQGTLIHLRSSIVRKRLTSAYAVSAQEGLHTRLWFVIFHWCVYADSPSVFQATALISYFWELAGIKIVLGNSEVGSNAVLFCFLADSGTVPPSVFTTFYIGSFTGDSAADDAPQQPPHFQILFTAEYGLSREALEELNFIIKNSDNVECRNMTHVRRNTF